MKVLVVTMIVALAIAVMGAMAIRESNNTLERTQWVESEETWNSEK